MKTVGILALQGDFEAHRKALARAGARAVEVRTVAQLEQVKGLIIPGGESTTMLKLMEIEHLFEPLRRFGMDRPVLGTCAGAILMARRVTRPDQQSFGLVDIDVERNAYGRQLDSHIARVTPEGLEGGELEVVFIRAPIIRRAGAGVQVLASYAGHPILVDDGRHLLATFHPELTEDARIHRRFVERVGE